MLNNLLNNFSRTAICMGNDFAVDTADSIYRLILGLNSFSDLQAVLGQEGKSPWCNQRSLKLTKFVLSFGSLR